MPAIDFETKLPTTKGNFDYPKLKLKTNEQGRIVLLGKPVMEYTHELRKPTILNGVVQMETKKRFKDQSEYQAIKQDFLKRYICMGDEGILANDGIDPKNCPICKAASTSDIVKSPVPRFAMNIIQYATQTGSTDIMEPYSVTTKVWAFTENVFGQLQKHAKEWGDLKQHDLLLNCRSGDFNQYDINVSKAAQWLQDDARKKLTVETFKVNGLKNEELSAVIGSVGKVDTIADELTQIRQAWAIVNGTAAAPADASAAATFNVGSGDLDAGLDDLLNATTVTTETATPAGSFDDLVGGDDLLGSIIGDTVKDEPKSAPATAAVVPADEGDAELAALLDGLEL